MKKNYWTKCVTNKCVLFMKFDVNVELKLWNSHTVAEVNKCSPERISGEDFTCICKRFTLVRHQEACLTGKVKTQRLYK